MPGFAELTLRHSQHAASILGGFSFLRGQNNLLCDCTLLIEDQEFLIHKPLLAASSEFFRALLTTNMKEVNSSKIALNGISAQTFRSVLDYIYTGEIKLHPDNITNVYAAADMLQLKNLQNLCQDYLLGQLCNSNCIGIWKYARIYSNIELEEVAWLYLVSHFTEVRLSQEFLNLSSDDARLILSSGQLEVCSENESGPSGRGCTQSLRDIKPHLTFNAIADLKSVVPSPLDSLVVAGGYNKGPEKTCEAYCESVDSWKVTDWNLSSCKHFHWVGVIGLRIYAIAGNGLTKINLVMSRFTDLAARQLKTDAQSTDWEYEATLPHDCSYMKFCVMDECIYGCGEITGTTYGICRYSPDNGSWNVLTELKSDPKVFFQFFYHDSKLHLLGGMSISNEIPTHHFEAYDPYSNTWEVLDDMSVARYNFGVGVLDHCLYAVGGVGNDATLLCSVERYSFETRKWSFVSSLPVPRASMACQGWRRRLYCLGGESKDTEAVRTTNALQFDPCRNEWVKIAPLSHSRIYSNIIVIL